MITIQRTGKYVTAVLLLLVGLGSRLQSVQSELAKSAECELPKAPLSARARLGGQLFLERALSRDSTLSCASCHRPERAFADSLAISRGIGAKAQRRNSPSVLDVATFRAHFNWDGEHSSLEGQLNSVFAEDGDMGLTPAAVVRRLRKSATYRPIFRKVYGALPTDSTLRDALTQFQHSLKAGNSRFERYYLRSDSLALTDVEIRGWQLFSSPRAGCAGCHVPLPAPTNSGVVMFRDNRFHNLGVGSFNQAITDRDLGRFGVSGRPKDNGAFATPSLRNVELTAPYMHDGSIKTLEGVVDFYSHGGLENPTLDPVMVRRDFTPEERLALVSFLRTLTADWLLDSGAVQRCFFGHLRQ